jgi:hypothetical protein
VHGRSDEAGDFLLDALPFVFLLVYCHHIFSSRFAVVLLQVDSPGLKMMCPFSMFGSFYLKCFKTTSGQQ